MKKVKRGALLLAFLCMILTQILPSQTVWADDDVSSLKASKKIVSIVYDDSGSMYDSDETKWGSANYAMQAFAALLSEQDEMYITYMSGFTKEGAKTADPVKVDLNHVDQAVETIRTTLNQGYTPVEAVDIAMDKLQEIQDSDFQTQYWLVVLTDGEVQDGGTASSSALQARLDQYKGTMMSNGTPVYITYMGIGSEATAITPDDANQLSYSPVKDSSAITTAMAEIANKVSGRMEFADSDVSLVDSKTVQVHTSLPLYSIAVFSQGTDASVTGAEKSLTVERNISLIAPDRDNISHAKARANAQESDLHGNAAMITNGSQLIAPGDYTISFSEDVDLSSVVLLYQPAIEMQATITRNGVELDEDDLKNLEEGDPVDVRIDPVNPETGDVIPDSDLPEGITWSVDYVVDGNQEAHSDKQDLKGISVKVGDSYIECTMTIPGFTPQVKRFDLSAAEEVIYGLTVVQPDGEPDASYYRSNMGRGNCLGEPAKFYITGNGVPLTKEELGKKGLDITDVELTASWKSTAKNPIARLIENLGFKNADVHISKAGEDGGFEIYPAAEPMSYLFVKGGTYTVTVMLDDGSGQTAQGLITVIPRGSDFKILLPWIIAVILLILAILLGTKKRFAKATLYIDVYGDDGSGMGTGVKKTAECEPPIAIGPFSGDWWNPFTRHSSMSVKGTRFYADDMGGVQIKAKALKTYQGYGGNGSDPEESYADIVGALTENKAKHKDDIQDASIGNMAFYLCTKNRIKRIRVK